MSSRQRLIASLGLALGLVVFAAPAWALTPVASSATVDRVTGDHTTQATYVVETSAKKLPDAIKFGDANPALGINRVAQTDAFLVTVVGGGDSVLVTTKAANPNANLGGGTAQSLCGVGVSKRDDNGFTVKLVSISGDTYLITVSSDADTPHALSHVVFKFAEGERAKAAYD
jgi:hypothetical protein